MQYISTADDFFNQANPANLVAERVREYFSNIPESFWESLRSMKIDEVDSFIPVKSNHTEKEIFEHQLYLFENFEDFNRIVRDEDFLARTGHDTISLRLNETYLETVQLVNEGVLGTVWDFLKSLVEDPDPVEMSLNIIRLILDVIGIVPFTWAGFPIDIVANFLSALISIYKGEWFSAILSIVQMIDVSHASAAFKVILKPAMPFIEKVLPLIFRAGSDAVALEKGIAALKDGVIKLGDKKIMDTLIGMFKNIGKFILDTGIAIVKMIAGFMDWLIKTFVPFYGKDLAIFGKVTDTMVSKLTILGKNFDTASTMLAKEAEVGKTVTSKKGVEYATDSPQGRAIINAKKMHTEKAVKYLDDLKSVVKGDKKFMKSIDHLAPEMKEALITAKAENELIGKPVELFKKAMKDKELATHLAEKYGWSPGGNHLLELARSGDKEAVDAFFRNFVSDPKIKKALSKQEVRAFTPFVSKPEAFIAGIKNFDGTVSVLTKLSKSGSKFLVYRGNALRRLLNFMARIVWQKYGSLDCLVEVGAQKASSAILGQTAKLGATNPMAMLAVNEEEMTAADASQTMAGQGVEEPNVEQITDEEIDRIFKKNEALKASIQKASKSDCSKVASAVEATVGAQLPGSTANKGFDTATSIAMKNPEDIAALKKEQEKQAEYSKQMLAGLGLPSDIDVQHALDANDPVTTLHFADLMDPATGQISINTSEKSRLDQMIDQYIKDGKIKEEDRARVKAQVEANMESGDIPELKMPAIESVGSEKANENLFIVKKFAFLNK